MKEDKNLKVLPLGIQTFKDIINKNNLYVDKTQEIYKLLTGNGKYFFLSRPRRFGKSLLVSTLEEIFLGNKELFKDLWIYDKIEFKKYPVIKLTMNDLRYSGTIKDFENSLLSYLKNIYEKYDLNLETEDYVKAFKELIYKLANKSEYKKVVLLIDEYDKPIIEYISDIKIAKEMRDILKNFYETIKANDELIEFAFLTGVSKFTKTSVFSTLNNLRDITIDKSFSTLVGITPTELNNYFEEYFKDLSNELEIEENKLKAEVKTWYNGYSWDGKNFVYNPFSILYLFTKKELENYWFKTGTPTFLINLVKDQNIDIQKIERINLEEEDFDSYDIENLNIYALFFQTGYLTIKEIIRNESEKEYVLSYPNKEVKDSIEFLVRNKKLKELII